MQTTDTSSMQNNQLSGKSEQVSEPQPMQTDKNLGESGQNRVTIEDGFEIREHENSGYLTVIDLETGGIWLRHKDGRSWSDVGRALSHLIKELSASDIDVTHKPQPIKQEVGFFEQVTASFIINKYPQYSLQSFLSEISTYELLRNEFAEYLNNAQSQAILNERSKVVGVLIKEGYLKGLEPIKHIKPNHGNCCTCQKCGYSHDECVCEHNYLLEALSNPTTLDTVKEEDV